MRIAEIVDLEACGVLGLYGRIGGKRDVGKHGADGMN